MYKGFRPIQSALHIKLGDLNSKILNSELVKINQLLYKNSLNYRVNQAINSVVTLRSDRVLVKINQLSDQLRPTNLILETKEKISNIAE